MLHIVFATIVSIAYGQLNNEETLSSDARMTTFIQLLDQAGVSPSQGQTILAPTDSAWQAFRGIDSDIRIKYENQSQFFVHLRYLTSWHLITEGAFLSTEIFDGQRTLLENSVGNITVNQVNQSVGNVGISSFIETDIATSEGIIHVLDRVVVPPPLTMNIIDVLMVDVNQFSLSTMMNLALHVGLDDTINSALYDSGITFLVPPNRRFNRAEIDVSTLMLPENFDFARSFVECHIILDNYHEAEVFAMNEEAGTEQFLATSLLGTSLWITTSEGRLRFQSLDVLVADQVARNG